LPGQQQGGDLLCDLKKAIWFGDEKDYKSSQDLIATINAYIRWYNKERIQQYPRGLSPLQFREQALKLAG
jgi:hypothetical protein